jgi:Domain of unknown function (DUF4412)
MNSLPGIVVSFTFLVIASARADLTIVQKVDSGGQSSSTTVKIKGDMERIESPEQPVQILDGKKGVMMSLLNERKSYLKISADQLKAAAETITKFNTDKSAAKLTPTGKKETINGYETEEFVYEMPQFKASFWVAPKFPDSAAILKEMQAPLSGAWKVSNLGMPDYTDFAGFPVKTVLSGGGREVTTTIVSVKHDPLSPAEFEVPKDFKEMTMPSQTAPGAGSGAASPAATP